MVFSPRAAYCNVECEIHFRSYKLSRWVAVSGEMSWHGTEDTHDDATSEDLSTRDNHNGPSQEN